MPTSQIMLQCVYRNGHANFHVNVCKCLDSPECLLIHGTKLIFYLPTYTCFLITGDTLLIFAEMCHVVFAYKLHMYVHITHFQIVIA